MGRYIYAIFLVACAWPESKCCLACIFFPHCKFQVQVPIKLQTTHVPFFFSFLHLFSCLMKYIKVNLCHFFCSPVLQLIEPRVNKTTEYGKKRSNIPGKTILLVYLCWCMQLSQHSHDSNFTFVYVFNLILSLRALTTFSHLFDCKTWTMSLSSPGPVISRSVGLCIELFYLFGLQAVWLSLKKKNTRTNHIRTVNKPARTMNL